MKVSAKIVSRCDACRKEKGVSGFARCSCNIKRKYLIDYRINGKRRYETVGLSKKNAERRLTEIMTKVHDGTFFETENVVTTFEAFAKKWLETYSKPRVTTHTYATYGGYVRNHLNPFKDSDITKITQEEIEDLLTNLLEKLNPKTVNRVLTMLKTLFKYARRWKYREDNPVWDIDKFKEKHREMDYLKPAEIRVLLEHSRDVQRTLFLTAVMTGMRKSELLGLQWGDIDWHSNAIYVRRSIRWKERKEMKNAEDRRWWFGAPKTKRSKRAIIMSPKLKEALEQHKFDETVRLAQLEQKERPINSDDLVFTNSIGNPLDGDNINDRWFHPALEAAGLRRIRFHDLRHSFASLLINQGENLKFIQSQLGHASIQTTIDRYGHLMPLETYSGVGDRIDQNVFNLDASGMQKSNKTGETTCISK